MRLLLLMWFGPSCRMQTTRFGLKVVCFERVLTKHVLNSRKLCIGEIPSLLQRPWNPSLGPSISTKDIMPLRDLRSLDPQRKNLIFHQNQSLTWSTIPYHEVYQGTHQGIPQLKKIGITHTTFTLKTDCNLSKWHIARLPSKFKMQCHGILAPNLITKYPYNAKDFKGVPWNSNPNLLQVEGVLFTIPSPHWLLALPQQHLLL